MREPFFPQKEKGYGGPSFHPGVSLRTVFMAMSMMGQRASGKLDLHSRTSEEIAELAEADADALMEKVTKC